MWSQVNQNFKNAGTETQCMQAVDSMLWGQGKIIYVMEIGQHYK